MSTHGWFGRKRAQLVLVLTTGVLALVSCNRDSLESAPTESTSFAVQSGAHVVSVTIEPHWVHQLMVGDALPLRAVARLSDGSTLDVTEQGTWSSSDPARGTVSNDPGSRGTLDALSPGPFKITYGYAYAHIPPGILEGIIFAVRPAVVTQHNDNQRTGANLREFQLNPNTVPNLKLHYTQHLDGQIVAQPLYVPNVVVETCEVFAETLKCKTTPHNVIYVVTETNSVYMLDADAKAPPNGSLCPNCTPIILASRTNLYPTATGGNSTTPLWGMTGTPAIDRVNGILYVVAKEGPLEHSIDNPYDGIAFHVLGFSLTTLQTLYTSPPIVSEWPVLAIDGSIVHFDPRFENQRPGLLLARDSAGKQRLYVAFGGQPNDQAPYNGYVFVFRPNTSTQVLDFSGAIATNTAQTLDDVSGAAVWQSGNGIADDGEGNIYVATGNLTQPFYSSYAQPGNSVLKLHYNASSGGFDPPSEYRPVLPFSTLLLNAEDMDVSAAGVVMLPAPVSVPSIFAPLATGKDGIFRLLNPVTMVSAQPPFQGTFNLWNSGCEPQLCPSGSPGREEYPQVHGSPVYWGDSSGGRVYVWAQRDALRGMAYSPTGFSVSGPDLFAGCLGKCANPCDDVGALDCVLSGGQTVQDTAVGTQWTQSGDSWTPELASTGMPGGILSLTANDTVPGTGIVWAATHTGTDSEGNFEPGILRAFAADPESEKGKQVSMPSAQIVLRRLKQLWNNAKFPGQEPYYFAKWVAPTVVGGKVILAGTQLPSPPPPWCTSPCSPPKDWHGPVTGVLMVYGQ